MSKHTPGQWIIKWREGDCAYEQANIVYLDKRGNERHITTINGTDRQSNAMTRLSERDRADARLIAAAPELLEALKAMVTQIEHVYPAASTLSYGRDAVKKAEGA